MRGGGGVAGTVTLVSAAAGLSGVGWPAAGGAAERGGSPGRRRQALAPDRAGRARRGGGRATGGIGHEPGVGQFELLAGTQRIGLLQPVALGDGLDRHAIALGHAFDRVLLLHDIDGDGTRAGAGAGIFDGAFAGAIEVRTSAERDR